MKFFASILSLYILVLTVIPCCDVWKFSSVNKIENIHKAIDEPSNEIDHCSPFCTCNCCTSPVLYQTAFFNFTVSVFRAEKFKYLRSFYIPSFYASIWQPPEFC